MLRTMALRNVLARGMQRRVGGRTRWRCGCSLGSRVAVSERRMDLLSLSLYDFHRAGFDQTLLLRSIVLTWIRLLSVVRCLSRVFDGALLSFKTSPTRKCSRRARRVVRRGGAKCYAGEADASIADNYPVLYAPTPPAHVRFLRSLPPGMTTLSFNTSPAEAMTDSHESPAGPPIDAHPVLRKHFVWR